MPDPTNGLTLEGLARILRDHMDGMAARFAEVGARIDDLRGENAEVAGMVRDLSQIVLRQVDETTEARLLHEQHRQEIRQIIGRMEQSDARIEQQNTRIEEITREIRQILDILRRRGGDGGAREP